MNNADYSLLILAASAGWSVAIASSLISYYFYACLGDAERSVNGWRETAKNYETASQIASERADMIMRGSGLCGSKIIVIATDELNRDRRTYAGAAAALKKIRDIAEAM